jgi:hypothetical protein
MRDAAIVEVVHRHDGGCIRLAFRATALPEQLDGVAPLEKCALRLIAGAFVVLRVPLEIYVNANFLWFTLLNPFFSSKAAARAARRPLFQVVRMVLSFGDSPSRFSSSVTGMLMAPS